ncbi:PRC-barrel domain-containing protein [Parasphingorhabdus sp.]|uniref:PRC-barrel domain-containing protein n=1 Tax=Parasphingorhabdus sp. TaxID=2709688 RepID=UPI003C7456C1
MMLRDKEKNSDLIGSDRVEGTAVYGADNDKIGSVEKLLIEKRGGQVTDAILSVGGFLGIGNEHHSIPWSKLDYDTDLGGYRLDVTEEQLKDAPRFASNNADRAYDRDYQTSVYDYWTVTPYW